MVTETAGGTNGGVAERLSTMKSGSARTKSISLSELWTVLSSLSVICALSSTCLMVVSAINRTVARLLASGVAVIVCISAPVPPTNLPPVVVKVTTRFWIPAAMSAKTLISVAPSAGTLLVEVPIRTASGLR